MGLVVDPFFLQSLAVLQVALQVALPVVLLCARLFYYLANCRRVLVAGPLVNCRAELMVVAQPVV